MIVHENPNPSTGVIEKLFNKKFRAFFNGKKILTIFLVLFSIVLGLFWLVTTIILFALIYNIALRFITLISSSFFKKMAKGIFLFLFLLSSLICIKLLAFDIYKIPSSSMENMLYPGDVIVVNKLKYGPELPRSPFEIP